MHFQRVIIVSSIIIILFSVLWLILSSLIHQKIPNTIAPNLGEVYVFDYVIVGAGTAGCVLTSILTKHSNETVLLIEAGDSFGLLSKIPLLTTFQQKGLNDWGFKSVRQKHSSRGLDEEQQCLPRGKGLGGSAQLNYMLHFDGNPLDFDNWSNEYNLTEWRWDAVKPFLEASRAKPYEMLEIQQQYSKITAALGSAESEFRHKDWTFRRPKYNIKNGLRYNVLQRFLQPILNADNVRFMPKTLAKKIVLESDANGEQTKVKSILVRLKNDNSQEEEIHRVEVRKELIIAAGAYQSPQLLLASGIGDSMKLKSLKIKVQKHLPRVGKNLHDHMNLPLYVSIDVIGPTLNQRALLDPFTWLSYFTTGGGHFGNFGVVGHIDSKWDNKFGLTFFAAGAIDESALMSISNFKRSHFRALFPRYHNISQEGFVLISACLQPNSRGTVSIDKDDIRKSPPLIDPNYMSEKEDIDCTIRGVRAATDIVTSEAFAPLRPQILWPRLKECSNFGPFEKDFHFNKPTDRYLECIIRHIGLTSHHPGGTCAMGTSLQNSVVNSHFKVHGINKLRIVDASVLPTPISGNPNSIIVGMALRAATMILKENAIL